MHQARLGVDIGYRLQSMQGAMGCVSPRVIGGEAVWKAYREGYASVLAGRTHQGGISMVVYVVGLEHMTCEKVAKAWAAFDAVTACRYGRL